MKLYEIGQARNILDVWVAEHEGEVTPEIESLWAQLELDRDEKIKRVALYIREQEQQLEATHAEIARLQKMGASTLRGIEGLTRYLVAQMQVLEVKEVKTPVVKVSLRTNPPKVEGEVPEETLREWHAEEAKHPDLPHYVKYTPEYTAIVPAKYSLDKKAVVDVWKAKGDAGIPVQLRVTQGTRVEIK